MVFVVFFVALLVATEFLLFLPIHPLLERFVAGAPMPLLLARRLERGDAGLQGRRYGAAGGGRRRRGVDLEVRYGEKRDVRRCAHWDHHGAGWALSGLDKLEAAARAGNFTRKPQMAPNCSASATLPNASQSSTLFSLPTALTTVFHVFDS